MNVKPYIEDGFIVSRLKLQIKKEHEFPSIIVTDIYRALCSSKELGDFKIPVTNPNLFSGQQDADIDQIYEFQFFLVSKRPLAHIKPVLHSILNQYHKEIDKVSVIKYSNEIVDERNEVRRNEDLVKTPSSLTGLEQRKTDTIRIDLDRVEDLGNLVGELISSKIQIDSSITACFGGKGKKDPALVKLKDVSKQLGHVTDQLRDLSLRMRMIPVSTVFRRFPKLVRDLSKQVGKKICLKLYGEETKLDKTLIEEISDPLLHLIRNAVDHGIENSSEREAVGKDGGATICLRAYNEGNCIIVEVEDDGQGLDINKIKAKALEKGLITQEKVDKISDQETIHFIFYPGFSTSQFVSDLSGRGVGLDVVKSNIEKINGTIEIKTQLGKGTKFVLKLPLTLSIIQVLLVKDQGEYYAIPFYSILQSSNVNEWTYEDLGSYKIMEREGRTIPIFRLGSLFKSSVEEETEAPYLIELGVSLGRYGVTVDDIIGQQEIVIKSLGGYLGQVKGISGATIQSDGEIMLVLDVKSLSEMIRERMEGENQEIESHKISRESMLVK
ncbi:MAG: hypothetical protein IEMM0008_0388 [bacterium]|nr:MAG: hypothetical protein IEMM0008_0388 [bacterium]